MTTNNVRMNSGSAAETCNEPDPVASESEQGVFVALQDLSERLHVALHDLQPDSAIVAMANEKIPEAMSGLDYVVEKTNDAADRTMDLVERSTPMAKELLSRAGALNEQWSQCRRSDLSSAEFQPLCDELGVFFGDVQLISHQLSKNLSEILIAQEFQDLTGQVIQRVMGDVKAIEDELHRLTAGHEVSAAIERCEEDKPIRGVGPAVGPVATSDAVAQGDIDEILYGRDL